MNIDILKYQESNTQIGKRITHMFIYLLEGNILTYEHMYGIFEISYTTYKRDIKELKEAIQINNEDEFILIKNIDGYYIMLQLHLPSSLF